MPEDPTTEWTEGIVMAEKYPLPKWGLTMEEGTIVEWQVAVGDQVKEGQVLGLVSTDKIEVELESPAAGVIAAFLGAEGDTVPVGDDIVVIAADADDFAAYNSSG
jgi:pyruvate/2-oxoglutarate dehydrogenase complex dihydrolipoamide acyltransferase (E2) component